jgi:hypothetical protein
MPIEDTRVPPSRCSSCQELMAGALGMTPDKKPYPGAFSLCVTCGHIAVFAEELTLREPSSQEMISIAGDKQLLLAQKFRAWKARLDRRR